MECVLSKIYVLLDQLLVLVLCVMVGLTLQASFLDNSVSRVRARWNFKVLVRDGSGEQRLFSSLSLP